MHKRFFARTFLSALCLLFVASLASATCLPLCGGICYEFGVKCCVCCAPPGGPITCGPGFAAADMSSATPEPFLSDEACGDDAATAEPVAADAPEAPAAAPDAASAHS